MLPWHRALSHCRKVSAITGSACNSTELNKNQKNAKHQQRMMENKIGVFIHSSVHKNRAHLPLKHCVQFCSPPLSATGGENQADKGNQVVDF